MKQRIRNILFEATTFADRPNINDKFWKWFGSSKVVDERGDPLMMYHGTRSDFNEFSKRMKKLNFAQSELGFYFTNGAIPNIEKGILYGATASEYAERAIGTTFSGPNVMPVYLSIQNPLILNADNYYSPVAFVDKNRNDIAKRISDEGYDGIISKNENAEDFGSEWVCVVFESEQIKSIFNQGTWNINNPDIMK